MQDAINEMLLNVALAGLTLLSFIAIYYIRRASAKLSAETAKIDADAQRALVQAAIERLDDVATKTVHQIEQTVASHLRESVKEGWSPREELMELAPQAYSEIVRQLKPEYLRALHDTLGDAEGYIMSTIESKVLELKERAG
ncbi:guanylate kinase [Paenibacillus melissococcoides]|nr:guanylate kinase [Paenibacillus melissococcoides]